MWGQPPAVHRAAPLTATRKPHTFSKYPLREDDALPCCPFLKLFQGSPESSHTSLLRDTKLIILVHKMCLQIYLIPVISTWHDGLVFLTWLQLHSALRQYPKSNPETFLQLSHTWASWLSPPETETHAVLLAVRVASLALASSQNC